MGAYILRRILLMIPTILGIMAISFAIIQFAPGGPVEQVIAELTGQGGGASDRLSGGDSNLSGENAGDSGGDISSNTGARKALILNSLNSWKNSLVLTNRPLPVLH